MGDHLETHRASAVTCSKRGRLDQPRVRWSALTQGAISATLVRPYRLHPLRTPARSVRVPVIRVREMRMRVRDRRVDVLVTVPGSARHRLGVRMIVVAVVVPVPMVVPHRLMGVFMLVPLTQMQPHAERHQYGRHQQRNRQRLAQHKRHDRTEERRHREVGAGARAVPTCRSATMNNTRLTP